MVNVGCFQKGVVDIKDVVCQFAIQCAFVLAWLNLCFKHVCKGEILVFWYSVLNSSDSTWPSSNFSRNFQICIKKMIEVLKNQSGCKQMTLWFWLKVGWNEEFSENKNSVISISSVFEAFKTRNQWFLSIFHWLFQFNFVLFEFDSIVIPSSDSI